MGFATLESPRFLSAVFYERVSNRRGPCIAAENSRGENDTLLFAQERSC